MADPIIRFDDLYLIDDRPGYVPLCQRLDAELELKCFAAIEPDTGNHVAGIIVFNLFAEACCFIDTRSVTNRPWPLKIIPYLTLGGMLGIAMFVLALLVYLMSDCCYTSLFDIDLAFLGIAIAVGSAIMIAALLLLSARLFPPRFFATVEVPQDLMDALVGQHRQFTGVKQALEASGKRPSTITEAAGADLAGRGVQTALSAILPAGLGELAAAATSSALTGHSTEEQIDALRIGAKLEQSALVLSHHRQRSGRGGIMLSVDAFRTTQTASTAQLIQWSVQGWSNGRLHALEQTSAAIAEHGL